jgi:hypothetical protein
MAKYFTKQDLSKMNEVRKEIFALREKIYKEFKVDVLDTDALSALSIHEIVSQYDSDYNINFARNGEDAISNGVLIEQKASRVEGPLTKTGKPRKNAGIDAGFQFHAMGDLESPRYIFVARNKDDLSVLRIYDIGTPSNCKLVLDYLMSQRQAWLDRTQGDQTKMKHDLILLPEKFIQANIILPTRLDINGCVILKD